MTRLIQLALLTGSMLLLPHAGVAESDLDEVGAAFSKLRLLEGEWEGILPGGGTIEISYEQINGGAIVERYRSEDPMWWNMSTTYHRDNDRIVMSHYCSWGNHPRMSAAIDANGLERIDFDFIDLAQNEPENGYMRDFDIEFIDQDRVVHYWTWREDGVDTPLKLTLSRVK